MKKLAIFFVPVLILVFISCGGSSSHKTVDKTDSVFVLVRYPNGSGYLLDSGIIHYQSKEVLDTQTHKGKWISDSLLYVKQNADTLRDNAGKPIFDSSHHPLYKKLYYPIPDSLYQIIHIKHTPFN